MSAEVTFHFAGRNRADSGLQKDSEKRRFCAAECPLTVRAPDRASILDRPLRFRGAFGAHVERLGRVRAARASGV